MSSLITEFIRPLFPLNQGMHPDTRYLQTISQVTILYSHASCAYIAIFKPVAVNMALTVTTQLFALFVLDLVFSWKTKLGCNAGVRVV